MRAGKLDRNITIERQVETVAPSGSVSTAWTNIATIRAEVVRQSADETATGYGEAQTGSVTFRIRYMSGITTADRVTYDGITYGLKGILEIGRRHGLELRAVATS